MKKLFASVLAVSMAITGVHVTSYASEDAPMVSVEAQKSNPYASEIGKELENFFDEYNKEPLFKKEKLLDIAINGTQTRIYDHLDFCDNSADCKKKLVALQTKLYVLIEERKALAKKQKTWASNGGTFMGVLTGGMVVSGVAYLLSALI